MRKGTGFYRPRSVDRAIFGILAVLQMANGLYLAGPWYLKVTEGQKSTLLALFNNDTAVVVYGVLMFLNGIALTYAAAGSGRTKFYAKVVTNTLLIGFLLRLYALIGVFLTIESWRPPSYLSLTATVLTFGAFWIWVKVSARPIQ